MSFGEKVAVAAIVGGLAVMGIAYSGGCESSYGGVSEDTLRQEELFRQQEKARQDQIRRDNEKAYWDAIKEHDESRHRGNMIWVEPDCKSGEYCP